MDDLKDVKEFKTESGEIKAELKIKEGTYSSGGFNLSRQKQGYVAEVSFKAVTNPNFRDNPTSVFISYASSDPKEIFPRLKIAEEGIETLLEEFMPHITWKVRRSVMACIFSLESQVTEYYRINPQKNDFPPPSRMPI